MRRGGRFMRLSEAIEKQEKEIKYCEDKVNYNLRLGNYDMAIFYQKRKELLEKQIAIAKVL